MDLNPTIADEMQEKGVNSAVGSPDRLGGERH
jgi:hypothetical protein